MSDYSLGTYNAQTLLKWPEGAKNRFTRYVFTK